MDINEMKWPLSKEELKHLYWEKNKSMREIGDLYNKTHGSVRYQMKKLGIKSRPSRNNKNNYRNTKSFKKMVFEQVGNEYKILGEYIKSNFKIKIKHKICGYTYSVTPSNFLSGNRRPKCAGNLKKNTKEFKREVKEMTGGEYKVLGEYKNARTKIKIKHIVCGNIYKVKPDNFTRGQRCPKCKDLSFSEGEQKIEKFLINNKTNFEKQFTYPNCKNKIPLRFDFKIKNKPIVIEYNGVQHYEPVEYFGGQEQFEYQQKNDKIKKEYCKENEIKLITIPYFEKENIKEILEKEL